MAKKSGKATLAAPTGAFGAATVKGKKTKKAFSSAGWDAGKGAFGGKQ